MPATNIKQLQEAMNERFDSLSSQLNMIHDLVDKNKFLEQKVIDLESKVSTLEVELQLTNQYGRRNNMEITGVPSHTADGNELQSKVIEILNAVDIDIDDSDIEDCHRLPLSKNSSTKDKKVIVRFTNRRFVNQSLNVNTREKLKTCDKTSLGLPEGHKIYFNHNFNKHFQKLSWMCRKLKKSKKISQFRYQNEKLHIKVTDSSKVLKVSSEAKVVELFPEFDFS